MKNQFFTANATMLNASEIEILIELLDRSPNNLDAKQIVTTANTRQKLSRLAEVYHIIQEDKIDTMHHLIPMQLTLETAIINKQIVSFAYSRYDRYHTVDPYWIAQVSGVNYLVAGQQSKGLKKLKKYRLDLITDLKMSDRLYDTIPWMISMKLSAARTLWFSEGVPVQVVMELDYRVAHFFREKQLFPAQEIIEEKNDGSITISFEVFNRMDFFQQVARWIPHFRIVDPPEFREFICERMQQAIELNRPLFRMQRGHHTLGGLVTLQKTLISILHSFKKNCLPPEPE